jgi:hypothetical protein
METATLERLTDGPGDEERALAETAEANARREIREPLAYQQGGPSYYRDFVLRKTGNTEARERLERHGRQMDAMPKYETRTLAGTEFEYRVNPNLEVGHGSEFAPPVWLNELFATAPRPGQVIQRLAHVFDMPQGVSSINLPRITRGTVASSQEPNAAVADQDVETAKVKAQAVVYAGNSDWPIQSLEQSPRNAHLDWIVFTDLSESLDAEVEQECIVGKGGVGEALGLLNITGINTITNTGAVEPKVAFGEIGQAKGAIGRTRKRPPDAWLMTTAREVWLAMGPDTEQRPLILTDNVGQDWPEASMAGTAVYLDDAIPITINGNQEPVFCVRSDDFLMWLSAPRTMIAADVLSGTLQVRFQLHRTVAAMLGRFPAGISVVLGSGMKAQQGISEYSYS